MTRTTRTLSLIAASLAFCSPAAALPPSDDAVAERYQFLLFYKQNDAATKAMAATIGDAVAAHPGRAEVTYVRVSDPAALELVEKYDVARAPMPLTVAVAPNGAITGVFAQKLSAARVAEAFVTPTMMFTMKSLQEGKLVLVSVHGPANSLPPAAIAELKVDPEFHGRVVSTAMRAADPQEAKFVKQMKIDPRTSGASTVVIAPPGVLIGKFAASATKEEIASALAKAGKCCDDPDCERRQ